MRPRPALVLVAAMVLAVAAVAGLAYWDEEREAEVALEDFAQHQAVTASLVAQHLRQRLIDVRRDARFAAEVIAKGEPAPVALVETYGAIDVRPIEGKRALATRDEGKVAVWFPVTS